MKGLVHHKIEFDLPVLSTITNRNFPMDLLRNCALTNCFPLRENVGYCFNEEKSQELEFFNVLICPQISLTLFWSYS